MHNSEYFSGKKVVIVGVAKSGLACANLLITLGAKVSITDNQDNESTRLNAEKIEFAQIKVELGRHTPEFIKGNDLVIISPGVPNDALPIVWARELNIPVISEIEFAWRLCPATVIAITGSNGKTTVATLIGKVLESSGRKVFVCGNIGTPFSQEVSKMKEGDFVVLEVSSFQLENIKDFRPKISVILNFSRNHLDRHKDMQEYTEVKKRIYLNQEKSDYAVLNNDDPALKDLSAKIKANVVYFAQSEQLNPNQAAVVSVGSILGIDKDLAIKVLKEFRGLEHRMEYVAEKNGVKFINDSKATTVDSANWALRNIPGPAILIAGGKDKGLDYTQLREAARRKVKEAILIGEAKNKIKAALEGSVSIREAATLEEAVQMAFQKASPGDYVLLSPMCSSFDMFPNYEERGKVFKQVVKRIVGA